MQGGINYLQFIVATMDYFSTFLLIQHFRTTGNIYAPPITKVNIRLMKEQEINNDGLP
jgi:hypothetical protein